MMGDPIALIEPIGLVEAADHLTDALRAMHLKAAPAAPHPAREVHVGETRDVVRVKVREQDAIQAAHGKLGLTDAHR